MSMHIPYTQCIYIHYKIDIVGKSEMFVVLPHPLKCFPSIIVVSLGQTFREREGLVTIASIPWTVPECWCDRKSVY